MIPVKIQLVHPDAKKPVYGSEHASGMDCFLPEDIIMHPKERLVIPLGFRVAIAEGYELQVRARSGLSTKGLMVANGIGTIDADYRGEVGVILYNASNTHFHLKQGDRICQLVLCKIPRVSWVDVDTLPNTQRGEGGYGSTG